MAELYRELVAILRANGCYIVRSGKGSHEIWFSPVNGRNVTVPRPTKSRGVDDFVTALAKSTGQSYEEFEKDFFVKARPTSLIKRFATPTEVATLVAYIASPLASGTTGAALRVDGGVIKSAF